MFAQRRVLRTWPLVLALTAVVLGACARGSADGGARPDAAREATPAAAATAVPGQVRLPSLPGGIPEQPEGDAPAVAAEAGPGQAVARYVVPTITCPSCAERIKGNARKDPGVVDVAVDLKTKRVTVVYDPSKTNPEKIAEAIRKGGDTVRLAE